MRVALCFQKKKKNYLGWLIRPVDTMRFLELLNWKPESYKMCLGIQSNETFEWMHSCRKTLS